MKKKVLLWLLAFPIFSFQSFAQADFEFDCDALFLEYYKTATDTTRAIHSYEAFCKGAEASHQAIQIALLWNENADEVDDCTRFRFEKYGVLTKYIGKTENTDTLDYTAAYNFLSHKRLKIIIPDTYKRLGILGPLHFGRNEMFTDIFYQQFNDRMTIEKKGEDKIVLHLEKNFIFPKYLYDIQITDLHTNQKFVFSDLFKGKVVLSLVEKDLKKQKKPFSFSLEEFENKHFCKIADLPEGHVVWLHLRNKL